jgi:hypothetical protein
MSKLYVFGTAMGSVRSGKVMKWPIISAPGELTSIN